MTHPRDPATSGKSGGTVMMWKYCVRLYGNYKYVWSFSYSFNLALHVLPSSHPAAIGMLHFIKPRRFGKNL